MNDRRSTSSSIAGAKYSHAPSAPAMLEEVERRSFTYRNTKTRIEKAVLGNEAGLYGAAYLPIQARAS